MSRTSSSKRCPAYGLDSRQSWVTAAFCGLLLFLGLATIRVSGVLLYGIVEAFGVTRQEASWPVTLSGSLLLLASPITGFLCRRYSCKAVLLVSSFVTGIATVVCYFAESLTFIIIFYGIIHGITLSGLFIGANVLVAQHFEKRRTTACSLMFTAGGINTIVLPPLLEFFRTQYGIRGLFLLYGAILMNAFPFAIVLRHPPPLRNHGKSRSSTSDSSNNPPIPNGIPRTEVTANALPTCKPVQNSSDLQARVNSSKPLNGEAKGFLPSVDEEVCTDRDHIPPVQLRIKTVTARLKELFRLWMTVAFWVNVTSFSAVNLGMSMFVLLSTDFANDRGIAPSESVYLLHALSASDIALRPLSGFIIDSKILSLESVMLLGFLIQGVAFELLAWFRTFHMMLISSALVGTTCGTRTGLMTPALVKDFGMEKLPDMLGAMSFGVGVVLLLRPPIVGFFRDNLGSYSGLLHVMAVMNAVLLLVWALKVLQNMKKEALLKARYSELDAKDVVKKLLKPTRTGLVDGSCRKSSQ
ncbi:monocarboxylate transporter 12-like [Amblyomma americanum]